MQTREYDNQPPLTLATFGSIFSEFSTDINMPKLSLTAVIFSTLWVFGLVGLNCICFRIFHRIRHPSKTVTATTDRAALLRGIVEQRKSSLR